MSNAWLARRGFKFILSVVLVISIMVGCISLVGFMESVGIIKYLSYVVIVGILTGSLIINQWGLPP